jgi:hypothetical protein
MTLSDLNPDALAALEAKLVADLEMVRRVRALLEEHRIPIGAVVAPNSAPDAPPVPPPTPPVTKKSFEVTFMECLQAMPPEGFVLGDFKQRLRKAGSDPRDTTVKTMILRLIREGKVVVVKANPGRIGSTYRCTIPATSPDEKPEIAAEPAPAPAVSAAPAVEKAPAQAEKTPAAPLSTLARIKKAVLESQSAPALPLFGEESAESAPSDSK